MRSASRAITWDPMHITFATTFATLSVCTREHVHKPRSTVRHITTQVVDFTRTFAFRTRARHTSLQVTPLTTLRAHVQEIHSARVHGWTRATRARRALGPIRTAAFTTRRRAP